MARSRGSKQTSIQRRKFLQQGALAGAAALVGPPELAGAQTQAPPADAAAAPRAGATPVMTAAAEATPPAEVHVLAANERCGSDYMVDVLKSLNFDYVCANPGSSFRGLHESFINYGGNTKPELITCCHEESSVAMAHGYFKVEGKPLAVMAHGTVGLQHAVDGALQRVVRPRSGLHGHRQPQRRRDPARGGVVSRRPGRRGDGARLHEVGRCAVVARRTSPNPRCARTRSR